MRMGCHLAHRARTAPFGARVWMIRPAPAQPTYVGLDGGYDGLNARRDRLDRRRHQRHLSGLARDDRGGETGDRDPSRDATMPRLEAGASLSAPWRT